MKTQVTGVEKMLVLSIAFSIALLAIRIVYTGNDTYLFYIWNIFLGVLPFMFSRKLISRCRLDIKSIGLLAGWLLFFPNAPYLVTDLFHFTVSSGAPAWLDMILVTSASWNGLALGIISLLQVEYFLKGHFPRKRVRVISYACMLLCGYGIYLGRFLRYNSWDIVAKPVSLFSSISQSILHPIKNTEAWAFTLIFSCLLAIVYSMAKQLRRRSRASW